MKTITTFVCLIAVLCATAFADSMSLDDQKRIITAYGIATGQLPSPPLTDEQKKLPPDKCGTAAVNEFLQNRGQLDRSLMSALGVQAVGRPDTLVLSRSYGSPAGRFLIHYIDTGVNAVYQPNVRTLVDSVPDYIVMIARIADSVYTHQIDTLGYPQPPVDGFYPSGMDNRFDIYVLNLSAQFYGLTYLDAYLTEKTATSYLELDNDYQTIETYRSRPLDAARVTIAHEYFHAIQFGIDYAEYDGYPSTVRRQYWMEASAVWMEEECYDHINDYYSYLPFVLDFPSASLQQFGSSGASSLHPYGSVLFALYLSQHYNKDIIREIWQRCADLFDPNNHRANFLQACEQIVNSHDNQATWATTLNDYAIWNFYSGQFAAIAPAGIGYEEAASYPPIPLDAMTRVTRYPDSQLVGTGTFLPQYNGTAFMHLEYLDSRTGCRGTARVDTAASPDTIVQISCDSVLPPNIDAQFPCMFVPISCDSVLPIFISVQHPIFVEWSICLFYQLVDLPDSIEIERFTVPLGGGGQSFLTLQALHPNKYKSITVALTPSTTEPLLYLGSIAPQVGFSIGDTGIVTVRPSAVLTPYPNPAVVSAMGDNPLTFRFQIASDSLNRNFTTEPLLLIDLYTAAGELVRTINASTFGDDRLGVHAEGIYETGWDMKNSAGKEVASGVYLAYARLWDSAQKKNLLAESKSKIALIR